MIELGMLTACIRVEVKQTYNILYNNQKNNEVDTIISKYVHRYVVYQKYK